MSRLAPLLLALAVGVVGVLLVTGGDEDPYVVYAELEDAGGILKRYNVKIGEVSAGKVTDITLQDDDDALIRMELEPSAAPVGKGATAKVRPVNLLGEKYVDLDPGDLQAPIASGATIAKTNTAAPVELDDALNVLDPDTRGALRILINEAGLSLAGRGADFNRVLEELPPALDSAEDVVADIAAENERLDDLAVKGDRVLASVTPKADDLGDLAASAADALETAAQRRSELGATVRTAPALLAGLRTTLGELQRAAEQTAPAARDIEAAAPSLKTTLERLPAFAKDARATLKEVGAVAPALSKLGRQSTPTLNALRPTVGRLRTFADDFQPLVNTMTNGGTKALLGFMAGWDGVTSQSDGLGHVFRLGFTIDERLLTSALERYAQMNGGSTAKKAPRKQRESSAGAAPTAPPATPAAPQAPTTTAPKLPKLPDLPGPVGDAVDAVGQTVDELTDRLKRGKGGASSDEDAGKLLTYLLGD